MSNIAQSITFLLVVVLVQVPEIFTKEVERIPNIELSLKH